MEVFGVICNLLCTAMMALTSGLDSVGARIEVTFKLLFELPLPPEGVVVITAVDCAVPLRDTESGGLDETFGSDRGAAGEETGLRPGREAVYTFPLVEGCEDPVEFSLARPIPTTADDRDQIEDVLPSGVTEDNVEYVDDGVAAANW